jgi:hypothetical protein
MVKHRTSRWAAITAKQNDTVTAVTTVTDPLEEYVPKNFVLVRILCVVEKEESEAIASGI